MKHRDQKTFDSFKAYWELNPDERFFQAIRNWLGCGYVFISNKMAPDKMEHLEDTFYFEDIKFLDGKEKK